MTQAWQHRSLSFRTSPRASALALAIEFAVAVAVPAVQAQTFNLLYTFGEGATGQNPYGTLIEDGRGNLYGTTSVGGTLSSLSTGGAGPANSLTLDAAGNLYGNAQGRGSCGAAFELQRGSGGWTYIALHNFNCEPDGENPIGSPLVTASGDVYGTASEGGYGSGTIWEITP